MTLCPDCDQLHEGKDACGFPVWTTLPRHALAGNQPCQCKRVEKYRYGIILGLTSCTWFGVYYSKRKRRICINPIPFAPITFWITKPGGRVPISEYERGLLKGLKIGDARVKKIIAKLRKIGDQCESGGHKSRARMFRALAKEFDGRHYL